MGWSRDVLVTSLVSGTGDSLLSPKTTPGRTRGPKGTCTKWPGEMVNPAGIEYVKVRSYPAGASTATSAYFIILREGYAGYAMPEGNRKLALLPGAASVFLDPGGPAVESSEVVQSGAANEATAHHLYGVHHRRVVGKGALDAYAVGDAAHGERGPRPAASLADYRSLERLEPLSVSFPYSDGDLNGVSRTELLYLGVFHKGDDCVYIHDNALLRLRCLYNVLKKFV